MMGRCEAAWPLIVAFLMFRPVGASAQAIEASRIRDAGHSGLIPKLAQ